MESPETIEETQELTCYAHKNTPTRLRCSRCDRPICGRCAIPASVGQHCPECVAEARRTVRRAKPVLQATAPAVTAILGINIAVYVLQLVIPEITDRFAMVPAVVAIGGEWWRLITAMFLHDPSSLLHILLNSYVFYVIGPNVEQAFGTRRFVALYLTSGFCGSVLSYTFSAPNIRGVGASGAIFGVVGALAVFLYLRRHQASAGVYLRQIMLFIGLNLALGFIIANIDYWAHIGGLAGGAAIGFGFERARRSAPHMGIVVLLAVAGAGLLTVVARTQALQSLFAPFLGG